MRLKDSPLLQTAFALEAVLDEVVFILGPVLVTFLATAVHPALGVSVSAVIGLVGCVAAGGPAVDPAAAHAAGPDPAASTGCRSGVLLPIGLACLALGAVFGGMEVVVVAFAQETGVLPYAGLFITVWSFGSLLAGVVTGTIAWRAASADPVPARVGRPGRVVAPAAVPAHPVPVAGCCWSAGWPSRPP